MRFASTMPFVDKRMWHGHFCLLPRRLPGVWVWLEWIEHRGTKHVAADGAVRWTWEYRDKYIKRIA